MVCVFKNAFYYQIKILELEKKNIEYTSDAGIVEHGKDDECVVKQDEDDQQLVEARLPHVGPAQDLHRQRVAKQPQEAE